MFMELHSQRKTMEVIAESLKKAPFHPRIISAIKSAHASGYFLFFDFISKSFFFSIFQNFCGIFRSDSIDSGVI